MTISPSSGPPEGRPTDYEAAEAERIKLELALADAIGEVRVRGNPPRVVRGPSYPEDVNYLSPRQRSILGLRRDPFVEELLAASVPTGDAKT